MMISGVSMSALSLSLLLLQTVAVTVTYVYMTVITRDLARNEEFSEIAVINIFFTVLKKKTQLSVGGRVLRGKFRDKSRN